MRHLTAWMLALLCMTAGAQDAVPLPASVHITRAEVVTTAGLGFTPPPYRLDAEPASGWQEVELPHAPRLTFMAREETTNGLPLTEVHWYRISVPDLAQIPAPHYLYIPRWKSDGQIAVYGDERLLYQSHANLKWNGSNLPLWIALDETADARPPKAITIRIEHLRGIGGALSSVQVGSNEALYWRYLMRKAFQADIPLMSSAAFLALGVFAFLVWLLRRHEKLYLLFFALSVAAYIRTLQYHTGTDRLLISDEWFGWLSINSAFWMVMVAHWSLVQLHGQSQPWLTRMVVGVSLAVSLTTLPLLSGFLDATIIAPSVYVALLLMGSTTFMVAFRNAYRHRSDNALLLAAWGIFSLVVGCYDWLQQNNFVGIESMYFGAYSNVGLFYLFTYVMFRRYVGALRTVEAAKDNLAQRLREREAELATKHEKLRESEEFLKEAQHIAGLGSYVLDIQSGYWTGTDSIHQMFGMDADYEQTYDAWAKVVHPDDFSMITGYFESLIQTRNPVFDKGYRIIRLNDRSVRWLHGMGRLSFDDQGCPLKMLGTIWDVTEQHEREAELAATHERLRAIERRQTLSQERQRLMQDMHDGLGSALVSALRVVEHGHLDEAHIAQVLKDCIDDLKLTIDSMEPVEADLLLLLATLRFRLAPRLESTGIALGWDIQDVPPLQWLTQRHSLHILRILQEAFANIIKHAGATEIRVSTAVDDSGVWVSVDDNGRGFDVAHAMLAGGMGLANQQRRARAIGASVHWNSSDKGTRFSLCLPL